jgi:hypothetical protein
MVRALSRRRTLNVRVVMAILVMGVAADAVAQSLANSYSALLKDDGHTWCAFKDSAEFSAEAAKLKPAESVRVTYSADRLMEVTLQTEAESGDWIVVDKYTPSKSDAILRRANLMAQENLQVIQETTIHGAKADPFHVVSVTTLDGKKAELSSQLDFPDVPVRTNLLTMPSVKLVTEMRSMSLTRLCKKY